MDNLWVGLADVFNWVVRASTYAVAAIIIISLVQIVGRRWLPANWTYALWLILLIRLALPSGPESRLSFWNLLPQAVISGPAKSGKESGSLRMARSGSTALSHNEDALVAKDPTEQDRLQHESKGQSVTQTIRQLIPLIWLAGTLALISGIAVKNLRLWRSIRNLRLVTDQPLLELFEDCKQLMGVRTVVGLSITDHIKSPSLFGFVRPRVLLPAELTSDIPLEELRYIVLHELAHFKRGDIWISWIVAFLQSLHWFNPLAWWAFLRMRADRELACDALTLSFVREEESSKYGDALINLLHRFSHSHRLPVVAGILENKAELKRRLTMITQFRRPTRREGIVAGALFVILSAALLTNAKTDSYLVKDQSAVNQSTKDPVKVGGGIQQSKLIYKVKPVYPENAKIAGLSGKVLLQVTTNEEGSVTEVKALDGHPILADAAFAAVNQWRYSPTLFAGNPVPVTTTVTVDFSTAGAVDTAFKEEFSSTQAYYILPIFVPPDLSDQQTRGHIQVKATPFLLYKGSKYYPVVPDISAPTVAIDKLRLRELANANWPTADTPTSRAPMYFVMYIDRDGGIVGIEQRQGPLIPEINNELAKTRVTASARFGGEAVPVWLGIEIDEPPLK